MLTTALNFGLAGLALALAVWTVISRDSFVALVGFVSYGLLLAVIWVQLGGVDVALIEAALGTGLTAALLVSAGTRLRTLDSAMDAASPGVPTRIAAALAATAVTVALIVAVLGLPVPAPTLAPQTSAHIAQTGMGNPLTAVLMAFRAMDTLLEAIVVLFALIGVWSLAPDGAWGGRPGPGRQVDPSGVLAFLARVLAPIGLIVGVYIFWIGADLPGGKFQGASLLAAMWLLVWVAGLTQAPPVSRTWLRVALAAGPAMFISVGLAGIVFADGFLAYPDGLAKPLIKLVELALFPSLALTLTLIVAGAPKQVGS